MSKAWISRIPPGSAQEGLRYNLSFGARPARTCVIHPRHSSRPKINIVAHCLHLSRECRFEDYRSMGGPRGGSNASCQVSRLPPVQRSQSEPRAPRSKFDRGTIVLSFALEIAFEFARANPIPQRGTSPALVRAAKRERVGSPQPARVGRELEPSVRRIAVRFHLVPRCCIEKNDQGSVFSVASTMENSSAIIARIGPTHDAMRQSRKETPSKQRERKSARGRLAIKREWSSEIRGGDSETRSVSRVSAKEHAVEIFYMVI